MEVEERIKPHALHGCVLKVALGTGECHMTRVLSSIGWVPATALLGLCVFDFFYPQIVSARVIPLFEHVSLVSWVSQFF